MARHSQTGGAALCFAVILTAMQINQVFGVSGSYSPSSCSPSVCPSVTWTFAAMNQTGNFTFVSSPSRNRTDNYLAFAFASGPEMEDALFVIDCYEPNGTIRFGTSRNVVVNGTYDNIDDPSFQSNLTNTFAAKTNGTLTCSFTLGYNMSTLAAISPYIFLSEGYMNTTASATPKKLVHFQKFAFLVSFQPTSLTTTVQSAGGMLSTAAATGQMSLGAVTFLCLVALTRFWQI